MFESLESRFLMAAVAAPAPSSTTLVNIQLNGSTLNITGSARNDSIYIRRDGSNLVVTAYNSIISWSSSSTMPTYKSQTKTYLADSVDRLVANLGGGNDTLRQDHSCIADAQVHGGEGNDAVRGYFGTYEHIAHIYGDGGNDTFETEGQFCFTDGGAGGDTFRAYDLPGHGPMVDYSTRTANVVADMDDIADDGEAGEHDNIERSCFGIIGGSGNDYLAGAFSVAGLDSTGEGNFNGNDGNDTIFGGAGFDVILGGEGDDQLHGGPVGDGPDIGDYILGEGGNDTLWGTGDASDSLDGGVGDDVIHPTE
jgi:Ca2+-binding RTX toxin-like protein